jgi:hypothetical protein
MATLSPRALARIQEITTAKRPLARPAVKKLREREDLSAETRAVVALAESIRRKLVNLAALPRRDPKTGSFTADGTVTPGALRKAWAVPARIPGRITPRAQSKAGPSSVPTV